ncbi:hypothetical protein JCM9140_2898 [Halalkalibacter wakoensis JCM 9140]|uniref:ATP-dependent Lon protease n=1 Tax=Halalkalibacter wakoensis JCM 9140 TaxID=1236970 RepID=W4Q486_9BACI|nr:hypothetical protein JCM9140_2898 [Halalkalibacter wakoensis JCM 9140]
MYLLVSIILSVIGCSILLMLLGPLLGGIIAFGIVAGCVFRGFFLLLDIHKHLVPEKNKVQDAYDNYVKERNKTS